MPALATLVHTGALAASVLAGVDACSVSVPGLGVSTVYQTINTNAQGYSLGTVTGYTLNGIADKGQPFSFTLNPVTLTASETFNLVGRNGLVQTA